MPTVPSFDGLQPASPASSWAKRRTPRRDTKHEIMLRRELWRMGLRYRKHVDSLPGKPDIVFGKSRVVVFCHGDFWHGRNLRARKQKLRQGHNPVYWTAKIQANVARDRRHDSDLKSLGWSVVRVWESDVLADPAAVACDIARLVTRGAQGRRGRQTGRRVPRVGRQLNGRSSDGVWSSQ